MSDLGYICFAFGRAKEALTDAVENLNRGYREEHAIVDRVWKALGLTGPQSMAIDEIVAAMKLEVERLRGEVNNLQLQLEESRVRCSNDHE